MTDDPVAMAVQMFGADAVVVLPSPEDVHRDADRAAFFAAARTMLDYLEARPELPLPGRYTPITATVLADRGDFAAVDRVASLLSVAPIDRGDQRVARLDFGGRARYEIIANTDEGMARYRAVQSYAGRVTP